MQKIITLLFLSGDPMPITTLAKISEVDVSEMPKILLEIKDYLNQGGLDLIVNNNEASIVTKSEFASLVEGFWVEELKGDLTPSALQVLTIIAYLNHVTRSDISFIRGVQSSQSIRNLSVRGLIKRDGEVCSLTSDALRHLGVSSVIDLPEYEKLHNELLEKLKNAKSD